MVAYARWYCMKNKQTAAHFPKEADSLRRQEREIEEELVKLRSLQEHGDVKSARNLVKQLEVRWPESERIRRLARTLATPEVRSAPDVRGRSRYQERAWLREHAHEYAGCWLA